MEQDGQTEHIMGSKTAFVVMSISQTPLSFSSEIKIGCCSSSTGVSEEKKSIALRLSSDPSLNLIWFHHKKRQAVLVKNRAYISMGSGQDKDKGRTNRASSFTLLHFVTAEKKSVFHELRQNCYLHSDTKFE